MKAVKQNSVALILAAVFSMMLISQTPLLAEDLVGDINLQSLKAAVRDLATNFPDQYTEGKAYLREIEQYETKFVDIAAGVQRGDAAAKQQLEKIAALKQRALLDNPLLNFDQLMVVVFLA